MYRIGGVRASPENAERLLRKNHLVTVFPEGEKGIGKSYKHRYHLQRFGRGGFIKLALRTGTPIIPCAVIGAEEANPLIYRARFLSKPFGIPYVPITPTIPWLGPLGLLGLPAKWHIHFGKPILLDRYGKNAAEDELLVHRLSEMVRQTIQEMIVQGLKKRRSVWFG
jgi:1-acyl-sn-glycerol-3-phosphate acyltransferase